jgi:hypothetical protein
MTGLLRSDSRRSAGAPGTHHRAIRGMVGSGCRRRLAAGQYADHCAGHKCNHDSVMSDHGEPPDCLPASPGGNFNNGRPQGAKHEKVIEQGVRPGRRGPGLGCTTPAVPISELRQGSMSNGQVAATGHLLPHECGQILQSLRTRLWPQRAARRRYMRAGRHAERFRISDLAGWRAIPRENRGHRRALRFPESSARRF